MIIHDIIIFIVMNDTLTSILIIMGFVFVLLFVFMCMVCIVKIINKYIFSSAEKENINITETRKSPIFRQF